jgi:hypothetical protein
MTGGGKPGRCTGESGIKSQEEIDKEVADNKITRTYDTTTRAYWYNYVRTACTGEIGGMTS